MPATVRAKPGRTTAAVATTTGIPVFSPTRASTALTAGRAGRQRAGRGDRSDWVKNLRATPAVTVELGNAIQAGRARIVDDAAEDERARALVHDKYAPGYSGDLSRWRHSALPVAVDLDHQTTTQGSSR